MIRGRSHPRDEPEPAARVASGGRQHIAEGGAVHVVGAGAGEEHAARREEAHRP